MSPLKKVVKVAVVAVCVSTLTAGSVWAFNGEGYQRRGPYRDINAQQFFQKIRNRGIKNVIVMIPDGCDEAVQTAARWYKGEDLQVDKMQTAAVKIHMANSVITGSAAAATAFANGEKTTVRFLGVGPRRDDLLNIYGGDDMAPAYAPIASVLEAAKSKGMATGIAVTSRVTHATPAAFACHIEDRGWDNDIIEHMVYNNIDVVFGGGARHLIPDGESYNTSFGAVWKGRRSDGENLMEVLKARGYQFVDNRDDMFDLRSGRVWGLFDDSHMQPDIDRQHFAEHEPSLAEMVAKAIELLSQDKDGFFLMVEGSQVDWAGHNNDPIYMVTDFLAFDDAVKVACDFAEGDGRTLVMAYPDHNTGGMKIGHYNTAVPYTATTVEDLVEPLYGMTMTANGVVAMMNKDYSVKNIIGTVAEHWGLTITEEDAKKILEDKYSRGMSYSLARVLSKNHTVFGWTTHGHNGETVPLWVYGGDAPVGTIDNTELAEMAAEAIGMDLDRLTRRLYVDIKSVTDDYEFDVKIIAECDDNNENCTYPGEIEGNGVLRVNGAEFPVNKDYMVYEGREYELPGVTVYASGDDTVEPTVYVSRKAVWLLHRFGQL